MNISRKILRESLDKSVDAGKHAPEIKSGEAAHPFPVDWISSLDVARTSPTILHPAEIEGIWTLRFGMFGWAEKDMRGGVLKVEIDGAMFGGDSNFVYRGNLAVYGSGLGGSLAVDRHGADPEVKSSFGTSDDHYELAFSVEPISMDRLEGYVQRTGFPDMHVSMIRLRK